MSRIRFRILLPVGAFAVTAALLCWGQLEEEEFWAPTESGSGWNLRSVWDYMPAGRRLAYMLNLPVVPFVSSIYSYLDDRAQHGPRDPTHEIPFILAVPFLWYWVGRGIDRRLRQLSYDPRAPRGPLLSIVLWLGFLIAAIILAATIRSILNGYVPVLVFTLGAVPWSIGLSIYFLRQLIKRPYRRDVEPGPT